LSLAVDHPYGALAHGELACAVPLDAGLAVGDRGDERVGRGVDALDRISCDESGRPGRVLGAAASEQDRRHGGGCRNSYGAAGGKQQEPAPADPGLGEAEAERLGGCCSELASASVALCWFLGQRLRDYRVDRLRQLGPLCVE
jgi:hypothetical protein